MFYYYGRKKRIAHLYPKPIHDVIIEPFAGSAAYSLHDNYWENEIFICDTNPTVIGIWEYLRDASCNDIQSLPDLDTGEKTTDYKSLSAVERNLIGLHINPGSSAPKITCTRFSRWKAGKQYILENLHKVKHWKIIEDSYANLDNQKATWFIDPPYQQSGKYYVGKNSLDFDSLGLWCNSREGQIIVCEMSGATWLPFQSLTTTKNAGRYKCKEVIFRGTEV